MDLKSINLTHDIPLPLLHQPQPYLLSLIHPNWEVVHTLKYLLANLWAQFSERSTMLMLTEIMQYSLRPPIALLWGNIGCAYNADPRVHQEQGEDLPVSRY